MDKDSCFLCLQRSHVKSPRRLQPSPSTFYINSRSLCLFSRLPVKLSKNILEKPLSLHVDSTVLLNLRIMKDKAFCKQGHGFTALSAWRYKSPFSGFTEDRSENSREKTRRWKKKEMKRKHEWKELKQWERGSEERSSLKIQLNQLQWRERFYLSWDVGKKISPVGCHALFCS